MSQGGWVRVEVMAKPSYVVDIDCFVQKCNDVTPRYAVLSVLVFVLLYWMLDTGWEKHVLGEGGEVHGSISVKTHSLDAIHGSLNAR